MLQQKKCGFPVAVNNVVFFSTVFPVNFCYSSETMWFSSGLFFLGSFLYSSDECVFFVVFFLLDYFSWVVITTEVMSVFLFFWTAFSG